MSSKYFNSIFPDDDQGEFIRTCLNFVQSDYESLFYYVENDNKIIAKEKLDQIYWFYRSLWYQNKFVPNLSQSQIQNIFSSIYPSKRFVIKLCKWNEDPNIFDIKELYQIHGHNLLRYAILYGNIKLVKCILELLPDNFNLEKRLSKCPRPNKIKHDRGLQMLKYLNNLGLKKSAFIQWFKFYCPDYSGILEILQYLHQEIGFTSKDFLQPKRLREILMLICRNGDLESLKFLYETLDIDFTWELTGDPMVMICQSGNFPMLQYAFDITGPYSVRSIKSCLNVLTISPNFEMFTWFSEQVSRFEPEFYYQCCQRAAKYGRIDIIKYLYSKDVFDDNIIREILRFACRYNKLDIIKYLIEIYSSIIITDNSHICFPEIIKRGHTSLLEYEYMNRTPSDLCNMILRDEFAQMVNYNHISMFQYLLPGFSQEHLNYLVKKWSSDYSFRQLTVKMLAIITSSVNDKNILTWDNLLKWAIKNNRLDIVEFIYKHTDNRRDLFKESHILMAYKHVHVEVLEFLLYNYSSTNPKFPKIHVNLATFDRWLKVKRKIASYLKIDIKDVSYN